nr:uncharacterized protein LOC123497554 [Aegilops tauschii subsp. strangulata]
MPPILRLVVKCSAAGLTNLTDPPTFILLTHAQLTEQVQALQRDKEILKTNLNKAEEEVKLLFEENRALNEANKRLLCLLEKEQKHRSERKHSASNSTKVKSTNQPTIKLTQVELLVETMNYPVLLKMSSCRKMMP